jgi:4,4'-dithiodibutanoate disulfide reductase
MALSSISTSTSYTFDKPLSLSCGLTLRNRIIRAAAFAGGTCKEQAEILSEAASGGVAAVIVAYTAVSEDGRTFAQQLLLDPSVPPKDLADIPRLMHAYDCLVLFQLTHAGGFANPQLATNHLPPLAPCAIFEPSLLGYTRACTETDITRLVNDFANAAKLVCSDEINADGCEIHFGHGYLLSQWLSPITNRRTDEHGGSILNRLKFPMRVVKAVRTAIGSKKAIFVKLNVNDGVTGGISKSDVEVIIQTLCREANLIDGIIPSAGFVSKNGFFMLRGRVPREGMIRSISKISWTKGTALSLLGRWLVPELPFFEGFLQETAKDVLAAASKLDSKVPIFAIGGYISLEGVEKALSEGFSGIQMARALIREPNLIQRWKRFVTSSTNVDMTRMSIKKEDGVKSPCSHCNECVLGSLSPDLPARCVERE